MTSIKAKLRENLWMLIPVFVTMLWGSASPVAKVAFDYFHLDNSNVFSILLFAGIRFAGAGLLTLLFSRVVSGKAPRFHKDMIKPTVCISLFQTILQYFFFYIGMSVVSGTTGALLSSTGTFFTVIVAVIIGLEVMTGKKLAGIILGMAGVIVLNLSSDFVLTFRANGELLILLSAICYAISNILIKHFGKNHNPLELSGFQFIFGGLVLAIVGLLGGGFIDWPSFSKTLVLFYLMLVATFGYGLWAMLLKKYDTSRVVIFHTLTPVFGALFSWILLGEDIWRWNTLAALLLVAMGITLINWRNKAADNADIDSHLADEVDGTGC